MRAFVKAIPGEVPEYIMVELQGELQIPDKTEGRACLFIYWQDENSPVCLIGHQMIRGKLSKLEKPFLVINTTTASSRKDDETGELIGECKVVMVIRRRLIFKDRPKPILF
ncbi:hypothetical protein M3Y97_00524400 [Aphelenchoides bicaudatus]|nr:hypothetical protein M3Y97_00524400 [Aphelenchoides bicaudatus]